MSELILTADQIKARKGVRRQNCTNCAAFQKVNATTGECHRDPPVIVLTPQGPAVGRMHVQQHEWCTRWIHFESGAAWTPE